VGDRPAARRGRRAGRLHVSGGAHREGRSGARRVGLEPARDGARRAGRRGDRSRLPRGGGGVRRRARHPRALGRIRSGRGPRGALHRHAARSLLDGDRRQRLFARRDRARRGAAHGCRGWR
jgi:hypothetical protein